MNTLWSYFWPAFAAGLLAGTLAGIFAFRGHRIRGVPIALGALVAFGLAGLWHGPLGGAERLSSHIERDIQKTLVY